MRSKVENANLILILKIAVWCIPISAASESDTYQDLNPKNKLYARSTELKNSDLHFLFFS